MSIMPWILKWTKLHLLKVHKTKAVLLIFLKQEEQLLICKHDSTTAPHISHNYHRAQVRFITKRRRRRY